VAWQGEVDVARNVTLFAAAGYLDNFALFLSPYQEIEDRAGNTTVYPYFQPQTLENFSANAGLRTNFRTGPLKHALRMGWQTQLAETGWFDTYYDGFASNIYAPVTGRLPDYRGLSRRPPTTAEFNLSSVAIADTIPFWTKQSRQHLGSGGRESLRRALISSRAT
jgi:iron complex outermembrane receptor protein